MNDPTLPILFLPGSYSTAVAWAPIQAHLPERWEMHAETLPGYAGVPDPRSPGQSRVEMLVDWIAEKTEQIGSPVHLVGHSYGALLALAAALLRPDLVRSLLAYECNAMAVTRDGRPFPWLEEVRQAPDALRAAFEAGEADAARIIIDFYGGKGTFAHLPAPVRAFCQTGVEANLLDWESGFAFRPDLIEFAGLQTPATLVIGGNAIQPVRDMNEALANVIPGANLSRVDGAGHFLISTHPAACADLLAAHLHRVAAF